MMKHINLLLVVTLCVMSFAPQRMQLMTLAEGVIRSCFKDGFRLVSFCEMLQQCLVSLCHFEKKMNTIQHLVLTGLMLVRTVMPRTGEDHWESDHKNHRESHMNLQLGNGQPAEPVQLLRAKSTRVSSTRNNSNA